MTNSEEEVFTKDMTTDLKGNPVLRSKTGGWKACSFIVVYEVFERMASYGISANLVIYLTQRLHMGTVASANSVTNWIGTMFLTPILGAYIADAFLGRYWIFLISSAIYLFGICLLTVAISVHPFKPLQCHDGDVKTNLVGCNHATTLQVRVFFTALYIVAIGAGGTKPNISTIGADQFDQFDEVERRHKFSFFNWWTFSIFFGTLFANSALVYIQDNIGWTLGYGIPTIGLFVSIIVFLAGTPFYRHKPTHGSPMTAMSMVFVAALRKWKVALPNDSKELHQLGGSSEEGNLRIVDPTPNFRFLNKASVKTGKVTPWRLCSVAHVEETKCMVSLIPIWCTCFVPCTIDAQLNTLFVKQGTTLDRRIGTTGFEIPPASLAAFVTMSTLVTLVLYDRVLVKLMRRWWSKNPRGITLLQRIGLGHILKTSVAVVASLMERWRLEVARKHGLVENGGVVPLTVMILAPQFVLMGLAHTFYVVGITEFFYDQAPENMKSLGTSFSLTALGVGNFLSSFLVSTVTKVTELNGHNKGWILNNLNASHLDYYYSFLAFLGTVNFIGFLGLCRFYVYKPESFVDCIEHRQKGNNDR